MASHSVRDEFASVAGSDGTTPPGESNSAGPSNAGAIYDSQHYQRHYATAPPIIWPATSASSGRTFTGIDPSLLTRSPPPPPPRTQIQTPATQTSNVQSTQRFHPYAVSSANDRSMPVNASSRPATQPVSFTGAQHSRGSLSDGQNQWQEIPLDGVQPGSGSFATGSNAASTSVMQGQVQGHGFDSLHGQMQRSSFQGAQPSHDNSSSGHGYKHGQSLAHPSAKPHPLQHLVDIHNAGPVSAFSRDPATFTGTTPYTLYSTFTYFRGILQVGALSLGP